MDCLGTGKHSINQDGRGLILSLTYHDNGLHQGKIAL
jgi:hypothetical protein